jgi:hypothetical protein
MHKLIYTHTREASENVRVNVYEHFIGYSQSYSFHRVYVVELMTT